MFRRVLMVMMLVSMATTLAGQASFKVVDRKIISSPEQYLLAPRWSPDCEYIAAAGKNYGSIWLYRLETGNWKKLVEENGSGWDFDWSPDSRKIAFRSNILVRRRKQTTIKYVDIPTGRVERLVDYDRDFSTPRWITNDVLSFMHQNEAKTVSIADKSLKKPEHDQPQRNICLFSNKGYYVKKPNQTVQLLEALKGQTFNVSFSRDGTQILFEKPDGNIYILSDALREPKLITAGQMSALSPDDKYIAYATPEDDGYQIVSSDIFICDINGSNKQKITQTAGELEMRPHWSPEGDQLACDSNGKIIIISFKMG